MENNKEKIINQSDYDPKQDPIVRKWISNYTENLKEGIFTQPHCRPIKFLENNNYYHNIPVILVAAGPSLDKTVHLLKNLDNKCLIICADVILYKLVENDIHPDFVVSIDPSDSFSRFWIGLDSSRYNLVCPTTSNIASLRKWQGNIFFFNQTDDIRSEIGLKKQKVLSDLTKSTFGFGQLQNRFFVGATMFLFSLLFSPSTIILVGYDFGFTDNKAYCQGFLERKLYDTNNIGMNLLRSRELNYDCIVNIDDYYIKTTHLYNLYKTTLLEIIREANRVKVINSTEGGCLTEIIRMPLQDSLLEYCSKIIQKEDVGKLKKRPRKKR